MKLNNLIVATIVCNVFIAILQFQVGSAIQLRYGEENHRAPSYSEGRSHSQRTYNNTRRSPPKLREPTRSYASHRREPSRESYGHYHSEHRQNLQWREKPVSRGNNRNEYLDSSDSSRARRPPLERTVTAEVTPPPLPPIPTTAEVMGELRDVTIQYTSCADPTESAARKQRVLQGEARGLMAQTAEQIVAAATLTNQSFLESLATPSDIHSDKSQDLPVHPANIPASTLPSAKKRRGRPPLNKPKPTQLTGSKSSKRNKVLIQNSPKRRNTPERTGQPGDTNNSTFHRLQEMHKSTSPDVIFLMETKNPDDFVLTKLQSLGCSGTKLVSPHSPGGGGLALLWKQHIDLEVLSACSNFIDTRIRAEGKSFFASFVYGEPDKTKRKAIWDQLSAIGQSRAEPWYLTGDFNDIINSTEKQGGPERPEGSFIDFRTFLSECDLFDLQHSGNFLSWRGQRYEHLVLCRLDRALSNSAWAEAYPSGRCEYLQFEGSDHRPLITYFSLKQKRRKGIFRYDRRLRDNKEISQIIIQNWQPDNQEEEVESKLGRCRRAIITWSREANVNSKKQIEEARSRLDLAMSNPLSTSLQIASINNDLKAAYKKEEEFWKQRSRQLWLTLGDKNSGYFHAITKGRKAMNKFAVIEDDAGQSYYEEAQILKVISEYYQNLFSSQEGERTATIFEALSPCISETTNLSLIELPSPEEIKKACFSIHPDKAPGPDGFSASFFHTHWNTVGPQIIQEIQNFFSSGILPRNINATHVRLIPKISSPQKMADYRPIALCTVFYKIIAKILTMRLQPILHSLVAENQSAFVPHLLFADDTMFFCKSDNQNCDTLLEILKKYELASGQMINPLKSAITFSAKTPSEIREKVKTQLGIQREGGLGKYLGLPELFGRKKRDLFTLIVDRIRQRACSWSSRFLSAAGKVTMLKSVLAAMPTYTMTCFKLPNSLYKRIQSALTRFWWDSSMNKKKMCWLSWQKLTKAKGEGGLGFRDLQSFNDALLAKVSWRILTKPTCLLARTLLGKYCHTTPFLDSSVPSSSSHGWRGICIGKELLKTQLGKVLGNGSSTFIWDDPWISLTSPRRPMGPPTEDSHRLTVDYLISPESLDWNKEEIKHLLPDLEREILEIKLSKLGAADAYAWLPAKNGVYTAKSGYYTSVSTKPEETTPQHDSLKDFNWKMHIWNSHCSPKSKFFLWKAVRGALPVGENLRHRGINATANCPFCGEIESTLHLFFTCNFAKQVWALAPLKFPLDTHRLTSFREGIEKARDLICLPPTGIGLGPLHPWILWKIWLARNQQIFDHRHDPPQETLTQAIFLAQEWQSAQTRIEKPTPKRFPELTPRPDPELIVCHSDAAWDAESKTAGLGWIFTNQASGLKQQGSSTSIHTRSPLMAEALAVHLALTHAADLGFTKLFLASDSKQLIEAINSETPLNELHGILHDILILSSSFQAISFKFTPREKNREADALAKLSLRNFVAASI
ncbi:Ribonuclease H domain [Arabidopsis thaliana x Arabidopsis arenosa]|uniref:Ribonuclease H domain n=1 Tax=Arabidopsis thaliana x Arabidopsis arenosa TaxID=1240361 RepID=A0A8T2AYP3_9BRAS|nr:Ribonuclease H domain [Arabidopsis thaliana x Arabidopsis arenosa]